MCRMSSAKRLPALDPGHAALDLGKQAATPSSDLDLKLSHYLIFAVSLLFYRIDAKALVIIDTPASGFHRHGASNNNAGFWHH
jgi:hypothetical protein